MSSKDRIAQKISELVEPVAQSLGIELVHVNYQRATDGWTLQILIDRPDGVTVDDCKKMSRELYDLLDVEDPIPNAYRLEISSPGLDRPLVKANDFERFAGSKISLRTKSALDGRKNFSGSLVGLSGDKVLLECDGSRFEIGLADIAKANIVPEIEGFPASTGN